MDLFKICSLSYMREPEMRKYGGNHAQKGGHIIQSLRAFRRAMELKKSNLDKDRRIELSMVFNRFENMSLNAF